MTDEPCEMCLIARALNAAATAAQEVVLEHALRFERREDYQPLEELAQRVQRAVVEAGVQVYRDEYRVTDHLAEPLAR